jgi:hypothetical protein
MLKQSASFVLGSSKSSTYPTRDKSCSDSSGLGGWEWYASGFDSPAALLDELFGILQEHYSVVPAVQPIEVVIC